MRLSLLAGAAFLAGLGCAMAADGGWHLAPGSSGFMLGTAAAPDVGQAVFITGTVKVARTADARKLARDYGAVRSIPLTAWRGKRVAVSLRLRNEGDARALAALYVNQADNAVITATEQRNAAGDGWQAHVFVLDVPANAIDLVLNVGLTGEGKAWMDGVTLAAAGADVPLTASARRVPGNGCNTDALCSTRS